MTGAAHWTDERTHELGKLMRAGRSISRAARELHVRRGAVSGRAHRLGWSFSNPPDEASINPPFRVRTKPRPPGISPRAARMADEDRPITFSVTFDRETFEQITAHTRRNKCSRAQTVRELVEWGLEAVGGADV